eukprot:Nitzschia sp. Nitz4//scaffold6_size259037//53920//55899//NITZ4_001052-RA/size259037-augustus-gene-0.284-mRNA-1//1//CDS//3329556827//1763//frame0
MKEGSATVAEPTECGYALHDGNQDTAESPAAMPMHLPLEMDQPPTWVSPCTRIQRAVNQWFLESAWPGMGLFGESYILFSIGTLKPLWERLFPDCFGFEECSPRLLHSLSYSVVLGVIVGMLVVGYLANSIGRRKGSILTASFMAGGSLVLVLVSFVPSSLWMFRLLSIVLFLFGVGVGGEYPLSASSASEKAVHQLETADQATAPTKTSTGRQVQLVFSMQGMGIWFNSMVLSLLLLLFRQDQDEYSDGALYAIWRVSYLIGALVLLGVLVSRILYLEESPVWAADKQQRELETKPSSSFDDKKSETAEPGSAPCLVTTISNVSSLSYPSVAMDPVESRRMGQYFSDGRNAPTTPVALLLRDYGMRLFGASSTWLLWDIAFYGNKLFQSSFLIALTGEETTLLEFAAAATLNATVALLGYIGAAFLLDNPHIGRLRLQTGGFIITGVLFILCGFCFETLSSWKLVLLYLGSTFFGQLGPNATTFLVPAEVFPTEMRTLCHGICAASGKAGALIAAVMFNFLPSDLDLFLLCGYASTMAAFISVWTIPETSGLSILEIDQKWRLSLSGKGHTYSGAANLPEYCSMYERWRIHRSQASFRHDHIHDIS